MGNFITAVAYHFCPSLPAAFTQPGASTLAELCTILLADRFIISIFTDFESVILTGSSCGPHYILTGTAPLPPLSPPLLFASHSFNATRQFATRASEGAMKFCSSTLMESLCTQPFFSQCQGAKRAHGLSVHYQTSTSHFRALCNGILRQIRAKLRD